MNQALMFAAVFMSLTAAVLIAASIPTKVYSQLPFAPTSPSAQTETKTIEGFSAYEDPASLFTIQYPSDWKILDTKNGYVNFMLPLDFESGRQMSNVIIVVNDTKATTLDQLATEEKFGTEHINALIGVKAKVIDESQATLSGLPAHKIVTDSSSLAGSVQFNSVNVFTLKNGKEYKVTYKLGEQDDMPIIQQMINSFRITK